MLKCEGETESYLVDGKKTDWFNVTEFQKISWWFKYIRARTRRRRRSFSGNEIAFLLADWEQTTERLINNVH